MINHPFSPRLNSAIKRITADLLPEGFDLSQTAPETLESLTETVNRTGRFVINPDFSDCTIFGDPAVNHQFRAWHDYCHYIGQFPFTTAGEAQAAALQIEQLRAAGLSSPEVETLIDIEVNEQAKFFERSGGFPRDQRAFTRFCLIERLAHIRADCRPAA